MRRAPVPPALGAYMNAKKANRVLAWAAMAGMVTAPISPARADNPVLVAVIGAGALIVAAGIGAYATVKSATITAAGSGDGDGADPDNDREEAPDDGDGESEHDGESESRTENTDVTVTLLDHGTITVLASAGDPQVSASLGQSAVDSRVRPDLERSVGLRMFTPTGAAGMALQATYGNDGDVLQFPTTVGRYVTADRLVWTLELEGPGALPFIFEELKLKTHDVPGSFGYSAVIVQATQNNQVIMSWSASVTQGAMPVYDSLPGLGEVVTSQQDRLNIENLLFEIPVTYDTANDAEVVITVYFENSGKRT